MHILVLPLLLSTISFSTVSSFEYKADLKVCRIQTQVLPISLWNIESGGSCFRYLNPLWSKVFVNTTLRCSLFAPDVGANFWVSCGKYFPNKSATTPLDFYFDYTNSTATKIIQNELIHDGYYNKWLNCAIAAEKCCIEEMTNENISPQGKYSCPAIWDAWTCFPPTERDTISRMPCPEYTSSADSQICVLYSEKMCFSHGQWNQTTDYSTCATAPVYRRRNNFNVYVCYVAIAICVPAVVIFVSFEKLRILRISLHRNLLISCIIRNILNILVKELVILDSLKSSTETNGVLEKNGVGCRVLAFFASASINAVYAWILIDGIYLHKLIARVFSSDPSKLFIYGVTTILTFLPTIIWATVVAIEDNTDCWMIDTSWYQWISDGFRISILAINVILLFDIALVLCKKLSKDVSKEHAKYTYILINGKPYNSILKKAFKSTFKVLIFLTLMFGVPIFFTANRNIVDKDSCLAGDIYYYVSYILQAFQGVMVAILFCYCNKEVQTQIKEAFRKTKLKTHSRLSTVNFRRFTNRPDTSATFLSNTSKMDTRKPSLNQEIKNKEAIKKLSDLIEASGSNPNLTPQSGEKEEDSHLSNRISKYIDDSVSDSANLP